jgi:hypothetical protein
VTLVDPILLPSDGLTEQLAGIPVGQHVLLVFHEDHFTQALATYVATEPRAIYRDVDVQFSAAQVEIRGRIRVFGVWVSATVRGNLQAQDCQAKVTVTDLSVGGSLTPALVRQEARKLIHSELEKALDGLFRTLPVCLESVEVLDGVAIVKGAKQQLEP